MQVTSHNANPVDGADQIVSLPPESRHTLADLPSSGTISGEAVRRGNSIELTLRNEIAGAGTALVTARSATHQEQHAELLALSEQQLVLFRNGENDAQVDAVAQQRANRLLERNENPHQLASLFTFADFAIDMSSEAAKGAFSGIPFAFANLIAKFLPAMDPAKQGALSGAITIALVHFGSNIIGKAGEIPSWGRTHAELEPPLREGDRRDQMTALDVFKKVGTTFQLFPVSFTITGGINSAIAHKSLDAGLKAAYGIGPGTAIAGSAVVGVAGYMVDRHYGRAGAGHILAEEDWEGSLDELKHATFKGAAANGLDHVFSKDTMVRMKDGLANAFKTLPNMSTMAQAVVWTGGISLYSYVTAEMNKDPNKTPEEKFVTQQMMFAAALFPITFFWTAAIALGPIMDKKAGAALAKAWEALPQWKTEAAQLARS